MNENSEEKTRGLPPKLDLRKVGILRAGAKSETSKISLDTALAAAKEAAAKPKAQVSKKETSRISLEAAKPTVLGTVPPGKLTQPAQVKPAEPPATIKLIKPGQPGAAGDSKRITSRIPLEAAFTPGEKGPVSKPKTIRLKKPGEAPTVKTAPRPMKPQIKAQVVGADTLSKTQRMDTAQIESLAELQEGTTSITRRKTIKVKRPTERPTVKGVSVAQAPGEKLPAEAAMPQFTPALADEPAFLFPIITIAAILLCCVIIYLFSSQTFGPNSSLTDFSYYKDGPNLGWPGKIMPR